MAIKRATGANANAHVMIPLDGDWLLASPDRPEISLSAIVPGCVHLDLMRAGIIEDPFHGENERDCEWISRIRWTWRRTFEVAEVVLARENIELVCNGLDTFATVSLNGVEIGRANNMFRSWRFDAGRHVKPGVNQIAITFDAILPIVEALQAKRYIHAWGDGPGGDKFSGGPWVRKAQCSFGWDWGPKLPTAGIWKSLSIHAWSSARLNSIRTDQEHHNGAVDLKVSAVIDHAPTSDAASIKVRLLLDGVVVTSARSAPAMDCAEVLLVVRDPRLWWPNGLGDQALYTVETVLLDGGDNILDADTRQVGLRVFRLVREADQWGESFYFSVNGQAFFAKGANWIPVDAFIPRAKRWDYERLIGDAARANMNMMRVWGGGIYERDEFYEICDRHGIAVWQDFMFSCATYPVFDDEWLENVRLEAMEAVRRLGHHACLALWCGNNEMEAGLVADEWTNKAMSWVDYKRLFEDILPATVAENSTSTPCWPSSPHTPHGDRDNYNEPSCGDAHLWNVWHGREPFEWYRTADHRFCSEFGFQSFPEPRTVYTYADEEERNISSPVMEHHQRSGIGNATIIHYLLSWYRLPSGFEKTLWLTQILQGMAMKYAVEHWRRNMPRSMGALYWQLNDCWPVASWSSIDYFGRWKALHYMARRFFAPVLLSIVEDGERSSMAIHVTNDEAGVFACEVLWNLLTTEGDVVRSGCITAEIPGCTSRLVDTLAFHEEVKRHGARKLLLHARVIHDGRTIASNVAHFVRPKHLELADPHLNISIETTEKHGLAVTLVCHRPALNVFLSLSRGEAVFTDNFIDLMPGEEITLYVERLEGISPAETGEVIAVSSLYELCR